MSAPPFISLPELDVCPSCGDFAVLEDVTGWCQKCSGTNLSIQTVNKFEMALAANADAIEYYTRLHVTVGETITVRQALKLARQDRAICVVCGKPMKHASRSAVFCRREALCRRYSRRYVYLYTERKPLMTKAEALATVLGEL